MAIFAILRLILSVYSNTKAAYTSSISAVRENRSPRNHQIFLADTNILFPRCDSEVFPDVTRRCGWWFLRLSQMLQGQRIRFSVIELVQSELEDVVGGDSIEKGQAGTHFHGVNATQYFSGHFRFVVK